MRSPLWLLPLTLIFSQAFAQFETPAELRDPKVVCEENIPNSNYYENKAFNFATDFGYVYNGSFNRRQQLSPNKKWFLSLTQVGYRLFNLETKAEYTKYDLSNVEAIFDKDSNLLLSTSIAPTSIFSNSWPFVSAINLSISARPSIKQVNLATEQETILQGKTIFNRLVIDPIIGENGASDSAYLHYGAGEKVKLPYSVFRNNQFSVERKIYFVIGSPSNVISIYNFENTLLKSYQACGVYACSSAGFTQNGKYLVSNSTGSYGYSTYNVLELAADDFSTSIGKTFTSTEYSSGTNIPRKFFETENNIYSYIDGQFGHQGGSLTVLNLSQSTLTTKAISNASGVYDFFFEQDKFGNICYQKSSSSIGCFNKKGNEVYTLSGNGAYLAQLTRFSTNNILLFGFSGVTPYYIKTTTTCSKEKSFTANSLLTTQEGVDIAKAAIRSTATATSLNELAGAEVSETALLKIIGQMIKTKDFSLFSNNEFQKLAYGPEFYNKYKAHILFAVGLAMVNPPIINGIATPPDISKFPIVNLSDLPSTELYNSFSAELKKHYSDSLVAYFKKASGSNTYGTSFASALTILKSPYFLLLDDEKREITAENMTDGVVLYSQRSDTLLQGMFGSKVYKFALNSLKKALGMKYKDLTDVTIYQDSYNKKMKLVRLSISEGYNVTQNISGFYSKVITDVDPKDFDEVFQNRFRWQYNNAFYESEVIFKKDAVPRSIVTTKDSPQYDEMKKDGIYKGVVIAGSNLTDGEHYIDNYYEYFESQGFKFKKLKKIPDTVVYIKENVYGKEPMDYFVKEAHSDGDEKNLFRVAKAGVVYRGVKKHETYKEVIELVFPDKTDTSAATELISNQDFGGWMKLRNETVNTELIYINGSCWSDKKALFEIPAAGTANFINLPSVTVSYTFSDNIHNGMQIMVQSLRDFKSFPQMREAMKANEGYRTSRSDQFIFPDEPEYKQRITEKMPENIEIVIKIKKYTNGIWSDYSIEQ